MADDADLLRQLIEESKALPEAELPGMMSWAYNHPSIINYRTKSQDRYDDDHRRAYVLDKLLEKYPRSYPQKFHPSVSAAMLAHSRDPQKLKGAYEPYTADHPLMNTGIWMQSVPAMVYAAGEGLANKIDPAAPRNPNAGKDFQKAANTFLVGVPEDLGLTEKNLSSWRDSSDMRDARDSVGTFVLDPSRADQMIDSYYGQKRVPLEGDRFLERSGVPSQYSKWLGLGMDLALDPMSNFLPAYKAGRAGKQLLGLSLLGQDALMGLAPTAASTAIDYYRNANGRD